MYAEQMLKCTGPCGELKSESDFYNYKHEQRCKACISEIRKQKYREEAEVIKPKRRQFAKDNPDSIRNSKLKQTYGLTLDKWNVKFAEQGGACAICKKPETAVWRGKIIALAVDHNHTTGENRGLLCVKCNRALGLLEESLTILFSMVRYILKYLK